MGARKLALWRFALWLQTMVQLDYDYYDRYADFKV